MFREHEIRAPTIDLRKETQDLVVGEVLQHLPNEEDICDCRGSRTDVQFLKCNIDIRPSTPIGLH
jgi:hypothetical protein